VLEAGREVERYRVEEVIGRGGMAVVYRVRHTTTGRDFAMKLLTMHSPSLAARLVQEGRLQGSLRHPNIVAVLDVLDVDGAPALVMEYVAGPDMEQWRGQHEHTLDEVLQLFRGVVKGVGHAHAQGMVHRDLKPPNVLLATTEHGWQPKITDFGIAKAFAAEGSDSLHVTRTGMMMGTPGYMAPEQIRDAKNVDERADLWSLGCLLFWLVTGAPPFPGLDMLEVFGKAIIADYSWPDGLDVPDEVRAAVAATLRPEAAHRLADCQALLAILDGADPASFGLPDPDGAPAGGAADTYYPMDTLEPESVAVDRLIDEAPGAAARRWPLWLAGGVVLAGLGAWRFGIVPAADTTSVAEVSATEPLDEPAPTAALATDDVPAPEPEPDTTAEEAVHDAPEAAAPKPPEPAPVAPAVVAPVPVVAPEPEPEAEPEPEVVAQPEPPAQGRVSADSVALELWLVRDGKRYAPGEVPAGAYEIQARFYEDQEGLAAAGDVVVEPGATVKLACDAMFEKCRPQ